MSNNPPWIIKNAKVATVIDCSRVVASVTECDADTGFLAKGNKQEWIPYPEFLLVFHGIAVNADACSRKQVMILYAALALYLNLRIMRGPVKVDGRFDMNPGSSNTLPNNVPNWGTM